MRVAPYDALLRPETGYRRVVPVLLTSRMAVVGPVL